MIRQPTPEPYAWWRAALRDPSLSRFDGEPEAGFYKRRYVRDGPFIPVEVRLLSITDERGELSEPERYVGISEGRTFDPTSSWTNLKPISRAEFEALASSIEENPIMAATNAAIDLSKIAFRPKGRAYA